MEHVGNYLRKVRTQQNLSLKDVCERTEITNSRLDRIELGKIREPSPRALKKLSALYKVDLLNLYLIAGYLDSHDISDRVLPFRNFEVLDEEECRFIQNAIDFLAHKKTNSMG